MSQRTCSVFGSFLLATLIAAIICAMPRASLRSVLLICAVSTARMCRVSTQIAVKPLRQRPSFQSNSLEAVEGQNLQESFRGPVAELVGIEGGVVSGVFNLESSGVEAPDRRPRHEEHYHEA